MGMLVNIERAATILGLDVDAIETVTDEDGNRLAVALQGAAMVTFLESADGYTSLQATVHDHASIEEAQQCASDLLNQVRHDMAEREAMRGEVTMALSQIDNSPLTGFMVI